MSGASRSNFDGPGAEAVREFFIGNAGYWIDEFHFDGLRLDATQTIHDAPDHVIAALVRQAREALGAGTSSWWPRTSPRM